VFQELLDGVGCGGLFLDAAVACAVVLEFQSETLGRSGRRGLWWRGFGMGDDGIVFGDGGCGLMWKHFFLNIFVDMTKSRARGNAVTLGSSSSQPHQS